MTELCKCGEPADGLGPNTCQMCWEQHCADTYWDQHNAMVQADIALFEVHAKECSLNLFRMPGCNDYFDASTQAACIAWLAAKEQAAQQKEGYVLVPVELTYKQALSVAQSDFDAGANIFNHAHRHLSNDDKAEIKGRWIGSKAFTIQDQYMALIKAAQEAE